MKITIYTSNTLNSACGQVIDALGKQNTPGSRHVFIAPDKFSLSIEKEIFDRLSLEASFNIDVVSFMRLAAKALNEKSECLSTSGALLVFKKILNRHASALRHYGRVARLPSFASEMYAVVTSFRNNCHTPEDILHAVEGLPEGGATRKKAQDIALLYKEYIEELARGYRDGTTRTDDFVKKAMGLPLIKASHIYIAGFSSFTAKQYEIIAALMQAAKSVTVAATPGNGGDNTSYYPYHTLERLAEMAEDLGNPAEIISTFETLKEPFGTINRMLFSVADVPSTPNAAACTLFEENTVYDEINGIAKEIARLVAQRNLRYREIAVVSCNDSYTELIRSIFARYRIPCFVDRKFKLTGSLGYRYLYSALEAAEFGLRKDKLLAFAKNPLCGLSKEEADGFENFVLARGISYGSFLLPFGDGEPEEERKKVLHKLSGIDTKLQRIGTFAQGCRVLLQHDGGKALLGREAGLTCDPVIYASNMQAFEALLTLLDEIETLTGAEEYPFAECKNILAACAEGISFSLIPQYADSVFVGNVKDSRYDNLDTLFVMAASADVLPASHDYKAILSAKDSVLLEDGGLRLYPTPADQIGEDLFALLDLFTKARVRLYFGYSRLSPAGARQRPSPVLGELMSLLGTKPVSLAARNAVIEAKNAEELALAAVTEENAFFEFLQGAQKAALSGVSVSQNLDILYSSLPSLLKERVDRLYYPMDKTDKPDGRLYFAADGKGGYYTKATQLEAYFACPYMHHLRHGLDLRPRPEGKLEPMDAGVIIHKVLEVFFKSTKGRLRGMDGEQIRAAGERAIEEVFADPKYGGRTADVFARHALDSVREELRRHIPALADRVKASDYSPEWFERAFDKGREIVIRTSGGVFRMRGKIDRADVRKDQDGERIIVIDYKTGQKDQPGFKDIYFGDCLQLWIYLKALSDAGYLPAGTFYLKLGDAPKKTECLYQLTGFFDEEELMHLDTAPSAKKQGNLFSSVLNIDYSRQKTIKNALTQKTLRRLVKYNLDLSALALGQILGGNIEKCPAGDACRTCGYLTVCGGAKLSSQRMKTSDILLADGTSFRDHIMSDEIPEATEIACDEIAAAAWEDTAEVSGTDIKERFDDEEDFSQTDDGEEVSDD